MPERLPRLTAKAAEKLLLNEGFNLSRQRESHRVYRKGNHRMVLPHHRGKVLHPKIVKELYQILEDSSDSMTYRLKPVDCYGRKRPLRLKSAKLFG